MHTQKATQEAIAEAYKKDYNETTLKGIPKELSPHLVGWHEIPTNLFRLLAPVSAMKYSLCAHKTKVTTARLVAEFDEQACNFAYLYGDNKRFFFYAHGGAYISCDGEFRGYFNTIETIEHYMRDYEDLFDIIEGIIIDRLNKGTLAFSFQVYPGEYPKKQQVEDRLAKIIDEQRLAIKLFAICIVCDFRRIITGNAENHMTPAYMKMLLGVKPQEAYDKFVDLLIDKKTSRPIRLENLYVGESIRRIRCGQKTFPLTAVELAHVGDITYDVWREIYLTGLCSNLVVNAASPALPIAGNWWLVPGTDIEFFDNPFMRRKHLDSDLVKEIMRQVREISEDNLGSSKKGFKDTQTQKTAAALDEGLTRAEDAAVLSGYSLTFVLQYVGLTFKDLFMTAMRPPVRLLEAEHLKQRELFENLALFKDRVFELFYALRAMNEQWMIHSDLHANNWCLNMHVGTLPPRAQQEYALFIVGEDAYRMDRPHYTSFLIDFSRTIIADYDKVHSQYGEPMTAQFFALQRQRMLQMITALFPDFMQAHTAFITKAIETDFRQVVKVMSALDIIVCCGHMTNTFKEAGEWAKGHKEYIDFTLSCVRKARAHTLMLLLQYVKDELGEFEWPLTVLMQDIFAEKKVIYNPADAVERVQRGLPPLKGLTDIYNYKNPPTWDIANYDKWGPISLEKAVAIQAKMEPDVKVTFLDCTRELFATGDEDALAAIAAKFSHKLPTVTEPIFSDL
jgi:hypothetical protein